MTIDSTGLPQWHLQFQSAHPLHPPDPLLDLRLTIPPRLLEADEGFDDGYQTDNNSTRTTSLSSSVRDYAFENGRRYHKFREGIYAFPNDEGEQEREDMKHAMIVNLCGGKLHFAPIGDDPQNIIDLGTGTGI
ncbi:Secondary metabolism regulator [Lachnellula suecica]|uniref:Secondary metabolism regulator n=1 Tax=Lachnellula suecica TaxID=602035 RepID=A0A8T9C769_9HELO|nr:Secondary metabolism regulator [Lachnellula suecica]